MINLIFINILNLLNLIFYNFNLKMKITFSIVLISLFQLLKRCFSACCEDCISPMVNTELPTPVIKYSEVKYTTPDKNLMCSTKFTVENGICCEQVTLEQHWLEFKKREEEKIIPLKQIFANTRIGYYAEIAQDFINQGGDDTNFQKTTRRIDKFFEFRQNYPSSISAKLTVDPDAKNEGYWFFDELYINNKLSPAERTSIPGNNLIDAIPIQTEQNIKGIFEVITDKYNRVNGDPISNTNYTEKERSKIFNLNNFLISFQ